MFPVTTIIDKMIVDQSGIPWTCKSCGETIGHVVYENKNEYLDMVKERGVKLLGTSNADIHCLNCGEIREWHTNQVAMDNLVNRVKAMRGRKV